MILSGRGGTFTYLMMMMMLWLKYACLCCLDDAIGRYELYYPQAMLNIPFSIWHCCVGYIKPGAV